MSNIRSTSSRTANFMFFNFSSLRPIMSITRPGVPTMICAPSSMASDCFLIDSPPTTQRAVLPVCLPRLLNSAAICEASSRVGTRMRACELTAGSQSCRRGRAKVAVLPVPVRACPMTSKPWMISGISCA